MLVEIWELKNWTRGGSVCLVENTALACSLRNFGDPGVRGMKRYAVGEIVGENGWEIGEVSSNSLCRSRISTCAF